MLIQWIFLAFTVCVAAQEDKTGDPFRQAPQQPEAIVCDCGFKDESNNVWTNIWHTDFKSYKASLHNDPHYQLMDYTVGVKYENSFERVFKPNNVKSMSDNGVSLTVKNSHGKFTSAAFGTKRDDFLYGTFRANMKTSDIMGTVAAFYYYRNSTSEIDIEALSKFKNPYKVYFAIQPQIYEDGVASNLTNEKHHLPFNPTEEFHEYRFDWLPDSVKFYVDGKFVREMVTNVPSTPGKILINHWTDGNPNFSGGPPDKDTELLVSNLNLFFNSSETKQQQPACIKSKSPCLVSDILSKSLVPEFEYHQTSNGYRNIHCSGFLLFLSLIFLI